MMGAVATRVFAATAVFAFLSGCAGRYFHEAGAPPLPAPRYSLAGLPQSEYWTGVVFNGAKVGFTHTRVTPAKPDGLYDISSEAVIHFRFLGFDKRIQMRSRDTVDDGGRLVSFEYEYVLDDSTQRVAGDVHGGRLRYRVSGGAGAIREQRLETLDEALYPASALDLLPVLSGLRIGSEMHWLVFNGETQQLAQAVQRIDSYETSDVFDGAAFKIRTDMLGLRTTTWIDARGRPVFELGLNGVMISALEDERTARNYLAVAALNKSDALVDWSLIKAPLPLADPRRAEYLRIVFPGAASRREPPSDERQHCYSRMTDVICEIDAARTSTAAGTDTDAALSPSATVQSRDAMIRSLANTIAAGHPTVPGKIEAILAWLDRNIAKEPVDTFSALDVLDAKRAECQGHAYLFAALARSLGVPTRVVNGLVYSSDYKGFLYHTWAESEVDGAWRAVDPTFGQPRADATHIVLVRGENLADLVPLVEWVGNTSIRVLEAR
jgi:hypothetical protein